MPNNNYTAILFINDRSGSMDNIEKPMYKAMHLMLERQARKLAGYITVDVGWFDDFAYQGEQDGDPMLIDMYLEANGGTQLYDNGSTLLTTFTQRINALPVDEQPGHVVVVIMTDGQSSPARTNQGRQLGSQIAGLIAKGWDFAFLAAYKGAWAAAGQQLNIPRENSIEESPNKQGVEAMATKLGEFISMSRAGEKAKF